jgi:hypothetical protein
MSPKRWRPRIGNTDDDRCPAGLPAGGRAFSDFEVTRLTNTTPDDWE